MFTLICALAPGCKRDAERTGDASEDEEAEPAGYDPDARALAEQPEDPSKMALIDPGAEPRAVLRHGPLGSSRRVMLRTSTYIHDEGDPRPFIEMTLTWAGASAAGEAFGYRWAVVKAKNDFGGDFGEDTKADEFSRNLAKMFENLRGQATGSPTGLTRLIQTKGMQATPSPVGQLYLFAVPLPEEAVGVGAVWERTTDPNFAEDPEGPERPKLLSPKPARDEDEIVRVERYSLADRQGDVLTLDYELSLGRRGDEEPAETASGRFAVVLGDPLAQAGSFDLVSVSVLPARDDREEQRFEHRQRISLETLE